MLLKHISRKSGRAGQACRAARSISIKEKQKASHGFINQ
jgi:hypothetical protein